LFLVVVAIFLVLVRNAKLLLVLYSVLIVASWTKMMGDLDDGYCEDGKVACADIWVQVDMRLWKDFDW